MSTLSLYASVCRQLLELNSPVREPTDEVWEETVRKLKRLKNALQCRICKRVRRDPYGASACHHLTCRECKEAKRGCFTGCRFCKNPDALELDEQHSSVLKCYAKVCELLQIYRLSGADTVRKKRIDKLWDLICEGVAIFDDNREDISDAERRRRTVVSECDSVSEQLGFGDVGHVHEENKVKQDGGFSKDGRLTQQNIDQQKDCFGDGEKTSFKPTESIKAMNENINGESSVFDKGNSDTGSVEKTDSSVAAEDKIVPKLFFRKDKNSAHFKLVSKLSEQDLIQAEEFELHGKMENGGGNNESRKNGFVDEKPFTEKDAEKSSDMRSGKRKNLQTDIIDDLKPISKVRKGKLLKRDGDHSLLHNSDKLNVRSRKHSMDDSDDVFHNNKTISVDALHRQFGNHSNRHFSDSKSLHTAIEDTEGGNEKNQIENCNRQQSLMRKNKYKCSCGSSTNVRYFADICSHKRCVCYAAGVPCVACKCRYCSNPHQSHYNVKWSALGFESDKQPAKLNNAVGHD